MNNLNIPYVYLHIWTLSNNFNLLQILIISSPLSSAKPDQLLKIFAAEVRSVISVCFMFVISRIYCCTDLFYCFRGKSYLQQMTALQDRARSRKYCRTPNVRAYFRVVPSIMRAKSFSLQRASPSSPQWWLSASLVLCMMENMSCFLNQFNWCNQSL